MKAALAYFLGLLTSLVILLIIYIFALVFGGFRKAYEESVCNFPEEPVA
jgi:hypothetical protein